MKLKLIRNKIHAKMNKQSSKLFVKLTNKTQYKALLLEKMIEESIELNEVINDKEEFYNELADVVTVLEAVFKEFNIDEEKLQAHINKKIEANGNFSSYHALLIKE